MENHASDPRFYVWSFPGCPVRVHLSLSAVAEFESEIPAAGDGVLFGQVDRNAVAVTGFAAARGRTLSELARDGDGRRVVGYYRVDPAGSLNLNERDLALADTLFSAPHHVFLRIQPYEVGPPNATFFFRDKGRIEASLPILEFPFDVPLLAAADRLTVDSPPPSPPLPSLPPPAEPPPDRPIFAAAARVPESHLHRWLLPSLVLLACAAAAPFFLPPDALDRLRAAVTPKPADTVALHAEIHDRSLFVTWNRTAPPVIAATSALLTIRDGDALRLTWLDASELRHGSVAYAAGTSEVRVELEFFYPSGEARNTVRAILSPVAASPAPRAAPPPAPPVLGMAALPSLSYTQPLLALFLAAALAGLLRRRSALVWAGVLGLFLVSWPPVEWTLSRAMEAGYPRRRFQLPADAQAVIVLSSAVDNPSSVRPYPLPDPPTYARCEFAAWIFRAQRPVPIVTSGGDGRVSQPSFARTMAGLLTRLGVPEDNIWLEEHARNTHESAVYSAALLRERGIRKVALVVDGPSMRRAAAAFRRQGIEVVPAPYELRELGPLAEELLPGARTIARSEIILHEALGMVWYWLNGWV